MFGFLRRKKAPVAQPSETPVDANASVAADASTAAPATTSEAPVEQAPSSSPEASSLQAPAAPAAEPVREKVGWWQRLTRSGGGSAEPAPQAPAPSPETPPTPAADAASPAVSAPAPVAEPAPSAPVEPPAPVAAPGPESAPPAPSPAAPPPQVAAASPVAPPAPVAAPSPVAPPAPVAAPSPVASSASTATPAPSAPPPQATPVAASTPASITTSLAVDDDARPPEGYELAPAPAERKGWMSRLKQGLGKTRGNLAGLFGLTKIDEALFEDLETALLMSDAGFEATERLLNELRSRVKSQRLTSGEQVRQALRELIAETLKPLEQPIDIDEATPLVMMIAGVNGAGKTTSIGKLTHHLQREGKSILLAAGDTFRAAAREQLATWGARNDVQVIAQQGGDPAAVAFDAVSAGIARSTGVVMVDTAGRLPTQTHLMDELKKIKRVIGKAMQGAPHQTLLILDGNTGQNMLSQVKAFDEAVGLTGLIVTKLDGTAKGGALIGLAWQQRNKPIPVYFIGVGEGIDDLQAFSAAEFAEAVTAA